VASWVAPVSDCKILLHPKILTTRAAEIAQSQRGMVEYDACGRPFVRGADPLAEDDEAAQAAAIARTVATAVAKALEAQRLWVRLIRALGREAGPPMGKPVAKPPEAGAR
jgi:hypothetical protein